MAYPLASVVTINGSLKLGYCNSGALVSLDFNISLSDHDHSLSFFSRSVSGLAMALKSAINFR
jgi:hypothetical protein